MATCGPHQPPRTALGRLDRDAPRRALACDAVALPLHPRRWDRVPVPPSLAVVRSACGPGVYDFVSGLQARKGATPLVLFAGYDAGHSNPRRRLLSGLDLVGRGRLPGATRRFSLCNGCRRRPAIALLRAGLRQACSSSPRAAECLRCRYNSDDTSSD